MKKFSRLVFAILFFNLTNLTFAQGNQHIPPCQSYNHGNESQGACWGYAVGRAFNRTWGDPDCPNSTLLLNQIPEDYFQWYSPFNINNIQIGDIVAWGTKGAIHVAYITAINSRTNNGVILADRYNVGSSERNNLTLSYLITERGESPAGYFRKKKLWSITVRNDIDGYYNIGKVGIYGTGISGQYNSPKTVNQLDWESYITIDAVFDGSFYNGYTRRFAKWVDGLNNEIATTKSYSFSVKNYNYNQTQVYSAKFKKEFNITFENNFISVGNIGKINVNGTQYNDLPISSFPILEDNSITATAINQVINGISYNFSHWSLGNNYLNNNISNNFYPTNHSIYKANFIGKPSNANRNLTISASINQPVVLVWNDNVNNSVTYYQIWRYSKNQNTGYSVYEQIGTVNRGIQTFIDNDFVVSSYYDYLLKYDVRGYYILENTYADPNYTAVTFGTPSYKPSIKNDSLLVDIKDYDITCYPNPFNPSTTLRYQLPNDGFITLIIYNELGKEIRNLVNEYQTKGRYEEIFDGANLASGVYFYSIKTNNFTKTGKLLLIK